MEFCLDSANVALKSISSDRPQNTWNVPSVYPIFLVIFAEVFVVGAFAAVISVVNQRKKNTAQPEISPTKTGILTVPVEQSIESVAYEGPVTDVDGVEMGAQESLGGFLKSNASSFGDHLEKEEIRADEKVGGFLEKPREDMMVNDGPVSDDDTEAHFPEVQAPQPDMWSYDGPDTDV